MPSKTFSLDQIDPQYLRELGFVGKTPAAQCAAFPEYSYCLYIPPKYLSLGRLPLIVAMHSSDRNNVMLRDAFAPLAERHGCAVLCPLFPRNATDPHDNEGFKRVVYKDIRFDNVLLSMIDEVAGVYTRIRHDAFYLYGFSGGAQFVHRMAYLHPEKLLGLALGAPGTTTVPDITLDYPVGLGNFDRIFDQEADLDELKRVPALFLAGADDTSDFSAIARGRKVNKELQGRFGGTKRLEAAWRRFGGGNTQFVSIPNTAHEEAKMIPLAESFFEKLLQAGAEGPIIV